jgi:nucleotide-binding universal stress UspA family protein
MDIMNEEEVRYIVCAVRGRPESRATATRAIDLALKHRARLTFLHVMDAEFLEHATIGPLSVIYDELNKMGQFTMMILCDRASRRGVSEVDYVVVEGNIRDQIERFILSSQADLVVMGKPQPGIPKSIFKENEIQAYIRQLEDQAKVRIVQVSPDH